MQHHFISLAFALLFIEGVIGQVPVVDDWKYVLAKPMDGWSLPTFDDSRWRKGKGGFGTRGTPGARVATNWSSRNIWLRKSTPLDSIPTELALYMHHDEDVDVYINGILATSQQGFSTGYKIVPLLDKAKRSIQLGTNLIAVHCRQTIGGQFIDVHLVDADRLPQLPPVQLPTTPFASELITDWGSRITPENAWREYPRPQLKRDGWTCLNGSWDYSITPAAEQSIPDRWLGKILVPFCLESKLGGVGRLLANDEALWYRRKFSWSPENKRTLLNFEAVDYSCEVFVNRQLVGQHRGGHTPFSFDISQALRDGENELIVRVEDDTVGWQLHGKQRPDPHGIWYTQVSGIWQTVWMEQVPNTAVTDLTIRTDSKTGTIRVVPELQGPTKGSTFQLIVREGERLVSQKASTREEIAIDIRNPKLWSPDSPHLYDLEYQVLDASGVILDSVQSYAGIRNVGKFEDRNGHRRLSLNDQEIFHWGPLDQGWWPDGLLTPPSDDAMQFEIRFLKEAGFNMIRKHIKVEPRRYYYHCDRLGMMIWQDQVSASNNPRWTRLQPNPKDAEWPDEAHRQFMIELENMVDHLESYPCIVVWVPFNEAWGQHRTMEVGKWMVQRDPTRLVNIASGGNFWPIGDIIDEHSYPDPNFPFDASRDDGFIKVVGEFGGHGFPVEGHLWDREANNWGYGGLPKNEEEYRQRYSRSLDRLKELKENGIAAGVYTQTTDVEGEINGLMTYDRKIIKIPVKQLRDMHESLLR
jgi:beta-galactosidase